MKVEYVNRYNDNIIFEKKDNVIEMTGFTEHYRLGGWPGEVGMPTDKFSMISPFFSKVITSP